MKLLLIGKIANTRGLKGDLKVISDTDFKEQRYDKNNKVYIKTESGYDIVQIERYTPYKGYDLFHFKGLNDINLVEKYKGKELFVEAKAIKIENDNEYHIDQIVGLEVFLNDTKKGIVKAIREFPQGDYLVVELENSKTVLVPFRDEFVIDVDLTQRKIQIVEMEGLI